MLLKSAFCHICDIESAYLASTRPDKTVPFYARTVTLTAPILFSYSITTMHTQNVDMGRWTEVRKRNRISIELLSLILSFFQASTYPLSTTSTLFFLLSILLSHHSLPARMSSSMASSETTNVWLLTACSSSLTTVQNVRSCFSTSMKRDATQ